MVQRRSLTVVDACAPAARKRVATRDARVPAELCRVLADETRMRIVMLLATQDEMCACDVEACFDLAQPTISHHMRVLRDAGLVSAEKRGAWVHYKLERKALTPLVALAALASHG